VRALIWIGGIFLLAFAAYYLLVPTSDPRKRDESGHCILRARVYTDGEGLPQPRRVLGMQNLDEADWHDVQITIAGVVASGAAAGRPSGEHVLRLPEYDSSVPAHKVREVPLDDFQSAEGPRWVALTMRVKTVKIQARIGAEACEYDGTLPAPAQ